MQENLRQSLPCILLSVKKIFEYNLFCKNFKIHVLWKSYKLQQFAHCFRIFSYKYKLNPLLYILPFQPTTVAHPWAVY